MLHSDTSLIIYFIRHAECETNLTPGIVAGTAPLSPLTERGKEQSRTLGRRFKKDKVSFLKVYASECIRAHDTAKLFCQEIGQDPEEIIVTPMINEIGQGKWEGLERTEVYNAKNLAAMFTKGLSFTPPEGESVRMIERKGACWLEDEILYNPQIIKKHDGPVNIAIVTHGMVIRAFLHYILNCDAKIVYRFMLHNTCINRFKFDATGWQPLEINDCAHLRDVGFLDNFFSS
ncbi:histidine phosphatase family protein [Candidatus Riflebacteria bacterium]